MVWLRRTTHYLFIVVVAVNSTLLTINAGDYIFYTDWAWTSFVVFSISQSTMLAVGAVYYLLFTGVPGTATYYATIMTSASVDTFSHVVGPYVLGHETE
jgi:methane/ammonia monooxygenase subunit A